MTYRLADLYDHHPRARVEEKEIAIPIHLHLGV